jgi:hypothetical protein
MISQFALLLGLAAAGVLPPRPPGMLVDLGPPLGAVVSRAECARFGLFPGIDNFASCRVYRDDSGYVALLLTGHPAAPKPLLIPLSNRDIDRLRAIVASPGALRDLPGADSVMGRFWGRVESGKGRQPADSGPYRGVDNAVLLGAGGLAAGSVCGGCLGAQVGITMVEQAHIEPCVGGLGYYVPPTYRLDAGPFCLASGLTAATATTAGLLLGLEKDRKEPSQAPLPGESKSWRAGCALGAIIPASAAAGLVLYFLTSTLYGLADPFDWQMEDPSDLYVLPAIAASIGITVEIIHLGYLFGRKIDRENARRARAELPGD